MSFLDVTPLRQLVRLYAAILRSGDASTRLADAVERVEAILRGRDAADRLSRLEDKVAALETDLDVRSAKAIRDHLYLPLPSHWSRDKPFLPFSTCSAADFIHPRYAEICQKFDHRFQFHRKLWEWVFIFHHLQTAGVLRDGSKGLGFGVGRERLPAVFASFGASITATDAPLEVGLSSGWVETLQHSNDLAPLRYPGIIADDILSNLVSHRFVDMNAISDDLTGFDFTWSACAFEHLGSLEAGIEFVVASVEKTLKPGGIAVHTTEFNLSSNDETIDSGHTVLYRRRDIERLIAKLESRGHHVQPFIVAPDSHFLDSYVDLPPYADEPSLKIRFGEFVTTSAGIVVKKA